ncbi:COMPLEX 1 LYR-LIKE PROTEIN [Salix viminalis]|uniref:COMPLEX 1 LYR-LIKE PROTEIN n=1 Tax=Salix viminalis TaxID=40686 RepID=A0A9Q0ZJQ2_SALVM|nr:COMPLEX 1 LYR-LIKE PROTEIN [Salix viminalis]
MAKGLIWATAEDLASNRGRVLSLYRQILRSLNSPSLPLNLAERLAKKAEVRAIFMLGSEETSVHNIEDLFDTADYALSILKKATRDVHKLRDVSANDIVQLRYLLLNGQEIKMWILLDPAALHDNCTTLITSDLMLSSRGFACESY